MADLPPAPSGRIARLALAGGVLMFGGGVFGAVAGAVILAAAVALRDHGLTVTAAVVSAGMGGIIGGVIAPVASTIFLRRVPVGLAIPGVTLGTVIGLGVGAYFHNSVPGQWSNLLGATIGFVTAILILRLRSATKPSE